MFGKIVSTCPGNLFRGGAAKSSRERKLANETDLGPDDLHGLVASSRGRAKEAGVDFPDDPTSSSGTRSRPCSSLGTVAARATTGVWRRSRRSRYRVTCSVVFGNKGDDFRTGVGSRGIRQPVAGRTATFSPTRRRDVVAGFGKRSPLPRWPTSSRSVSAAARRAGAARAALPRHVRTEFTVEQAAVHVQTRVGNARHSRSAYGVEMHEEGSSPSPRPCFASEPTSSISCAPQFESRGEVQSRDGFAACRARRWERLFTATTPRAPRGGSASFSSGRNVADDLTA